MVAYPDGYTNLHIPSSVFAHLPSSDFPPSRFTTLTTLPKSIFEHMTIFSHSETPAAHPSPSTTPAHSSPASPSPSPSTSRRQSPTPSQSRKSHTTRSPTSNSGRTTTTPISSTTSASLQSAGPLPSSHGGGLPKGAVAAVVVICTLVCIAFVALGIMFWRKRRTGGPRTSYSDAGHNPPGSPARSEITQFRPSIDALSFEEPITSMSGPTRFGRAGFDSFGAQPPSPVEEDPFLSPAERDFAQRTNGLPEPNITPSQHLDLAPLPSPSTGTNRVYHNTASQRLAPPRPPPMTLRGRQNMPFQPRSPATAKPLGTISESGLSNPNPYSKPRPRAASLENDGYAAARAAMRPNVPPSAVGRDGTRYTPIPYTPPRRSSRQGMNGSANGGLPVVPGRYQPTHHYPGISETVQNGSNGSYPEKRWSDGSRYSVARKPVGGRVSPPF